MNPKRPSIGVGVIVIRDCRVLIGKRKNAHGEGTWQFPGGHLEWNEDVFGCAHREVLEETGLEIHSLRTGPYTNDIFAAEHKHYITLFVVAHSELGEPVLTEPKKCSEWRWCSWDKLPEPLFLPIQNLRQQGFSPFS